MFGFSTNQVPAQLHLPKSWKETNAYGSDAHPPPTSLDEKVASLHLPALGAQVVKEDQEPTTHDPCFELRCSVPLMSPVSNAHGRYSLRALLQRLWPATAQMRSGIMMRDLAALGGAAAPLTRDSRFYHCS